MDLPQIVDPLLGFLMDLETQDVPGLGVDPDGRFAPPALVRTPALGPAAVIALLGAVVILERRSQ